MAQRHLILHVERIFEGPEIKEDDEHYGKIVLELPAEISTKMFNEIADAIFNTDVTVSGPYVYTIQSECEA